MDNSGKLTGIFTRDFYSVSFLLVLAGYLLMQLPFLTDMRPILVDEPVYAGSVYNFLFKNWYIKTTMGSGGSSNFILPLVTALIFKIFGPGLFVARLVAVLAGIVFLFGLRILFIYFETDEKSQFISFATVVVTSYFVSLFRYVRPECLSVTFILLSVIPFTRYYFERKLRQIFYVSFFVLLAFLSHPFSGVFFALYGLFFLGELFISKEIRQIRGLILFSLVGLAALLLLFGANLVINKLPLSDIIGRTNLSQAAIPLKARIMVFIKFWFLSGRLVFSIPFLLIMFYGLFAKKNIIRIYSIMALGFLVTAIVVFGNDLGMTTYLFNYSILFAVVLIPWVIESLGEKVKQKRLIFVLFGLFLAVNVYATVYNNINKFERVNTVLQGDLKKLIPENTYVLAPVEFWFFLPDVYMASYFHIQNQPADIREKIDYVIVKEFDNFNLPQLGYNVTDTSKFREFYVLKKTKSYGDITVYKRIRN